MEVVAYSGGERRRWVVYRAKVPDRNIIDDWIFVVRLNDGPSDMAREAYGRSARGHVLYEAFDNLPAAVGRCVAWMEGK